MYGEIYFHEYCLDRTGEPARISILKRGFEGAATEVGAGPIPFTKTVLGGSEDRVGGVYPTMASVRLLGTADFGMKDLYTADDSEFQVVHTVDGNVDWVGFLVPEDFSEEDHELNRILDLKAMDGLTKLKDLKFVAPNGQNYGVADGQFEKSLLFHLSEGLKKTGLNLELLTLPDRAAVVKSNATARIHAVVTGPMFYDLDFITPYQEGKIYVGASVEYELEGDPAFGGGSVFTGVVTDIDDSDIGDGGGLGVTINPVPPFLNNPYLFTFFTPTAATGDVLASTTVDTRMWVDPAEEIVTDKSEVVNPYYYYTDGTYDTWYVLDSIALLFDLKITQQQGRWVAESLDKQYLGEDYYRYNSDGVLLGRHPQNEIKVFDCETDGNLRLAGGVRSYGKTLKRVTVNYPYRNKVKGDPLAELIENGAFFLPIKPISGDPNPGTFIPDYWERQVLKDPIPYYLIREAYPGSIFGNSITISSTHDFNAYNRFKPIEPIRVSRGDTVYLSWEQSLKEYKFGPYDIITYTTLSIEFFGLDGNRYYLVNSRDQPGWTSRRYTSPNPEGQWIRAEEKWTYSEGQWIREGVGKIWHFTSSYAEEHNHTTGGSWTPFSLVNLSIPAAPADGFIEVRFVGASNRATVYDPSYPFQYPDSITWAYAADQALTDGQVTYSAPTERDSNPINWRKGGLDFSVKVANVSASKVISLESGRTVFFTNEGNYFDTLTVTTPLGDEDNPNHLSTLKIDGAVNSLWTDVSGTLGVNSIEMLLAQTLLRRYLLPHFIADGSLLADNLQFLDKLDLYEDGNIYGIRNGDIQVKDSAFDGSLEEYRLNPTPTNGYDAGANSLNDRTGGSGSGSGSGGSTGGPLPPVGSPVGLREVTEVGNTTPLDISVRGVQLTDFLGLPTTPPDPSDVLIGRSYIWLGDGAGAGVPSSGTLAGLEDVQLTSLTNGQSLVWNASTLKWENATISAGGGTWGSITGILSNQTDLQIALNNRELVANKATSFSVLNNTLYPTTQAVANYVGNGTLTINAGTGLTGSVTFSANQSSNSAVTIGLSAATQSDINLGVTAYGWGNHAGAGYAVNGTGSTQVRNNAQLDARYLQVGVADTFVPYTGANKAVDLNNQNLTNIGTFRAGTTLIPTNTVEVTEKNRSYYLISNTNGLPVAKWETQRWSGTSFGTSNSFGFGYQALHSNTGTNSNGFGYQALQNNTGTNSNGFGYIALQNNTGNYSNGFGHASLQNNTGTNSNGFGYLALRYNNGTSNNAFGHNVLHTDPGAVVRNYTTAIGYNIPWSAITKDYQTVFSGREIIGLDLTNARIDAAVGNALVTKDWVGTQIGNGQLNITTGTGLTGSGVFNANQSGNTSISIGVASGYVLPTDLKASQWDEAYGWGNHASAGYAVNGTGGTQVRNNTQLDARYLQIGANAASATKLATARTINGTAFDGTANITTASWGTARTLSYTGDVTGSSSVNGSANVATALTIANSAVTNAKLANMSANTFKGRLSTTGAPQDLTVTQVQTALGVTVAKQNEWDTAYAQRHTHANKAFLDTINQNLSTSSSVEFDKVKVVSLLSIPTSAPTSPVSGEAYIWVEMD